MPDDSAATETYTYYDQGTTGDDARAGLLKSKSTLATPVSTTYYDYDGAGHLAKQWGTGDYPVAYGYDSFGRLSTMTTYSGGGTSGATWNPGFYGAWCTTTWAYAGNALSWVISKTDAASKAVTYAYHTGGALKTRKWARGLTTTYNYDAFGRQQGVDYSDPTPDVTFTYDEGGRLSHRTDAAGDHTFTYTASGQLESESVSGGFCNGLVINPGYGDYDERSSLDVSWGAATAVPVMYEYTNFLLTKVRTGSPSSREATLGYDAGTSTPASIDYWITGNATSQLTRTVGMWSGGQVSSIAYTAPRPPGQTGTVILVCRLPNSYSLRFAPCFSFSIASLARLIFART